MALSMVETQMLIAWRGRWRSARGDAHRGDPSMLFVSVFSENSAKMRRSRL